jgi:murein DD-endopeptidase MepM/ murein hydrolase activator NlpD
VANHRADKRAVSRRRSVDVRGTSDPAGSTQPVDQPLDQSLDRSGNPYVVRESVPSAPSVGGRRKATRPARTTPAAALRQRSTHTGIRKTLIPGIPSAPTLIGAAALTLAAAGAITVSTPDAGSRLATSGTNIQKLSAQASALNGASSIGSSSALSGRERAVSRDSQREALEDAADAELQAAAEKQAKERNAALAALAASAEKQAETIARNAWQLPVAGYHLTSRFGECSSLWSRCHTGLDFAAASGTPIHAMAGGTVTEVGYAGAYGNRTIVTLEDGTEVWYCHQTSTSVSTGQQVRSGDVIGSVGSTGNTTGPHLHLEVRPGAGDPVDPFSAFIAHGITP